MNSIGISITITQNKWQHKNMKMCLHTSLN